MGLFCRHEWQLHYISLSVCLFMSLSSYLSTCLSVNQVILMFIYLVSLYQSVHLYVVLSIHLSYPSTCLSVYSFISQAIHILFYIFIYIKGIYLPIYLTVCLFIYLCSFKFYLPNVIAKACRRAPLAHQTLSFSRKRMCHVLLINYSFSCSPSNPKPHTICSTAPDNPPATPNQPAHTTTLARTTDQASKPAYVLLHGLHASTPRYCAAAALFSAVAHSSRGTR